MSIHARVVGTEENSVIIDIHGFYASLLLWSRGVITRADIVTEWNLSVDDGSDLDFLKTKYDAAADKGVFMVGLEALLIMADNGRFGMEVEATFVAGVNSLV